MNKKLMLLGLAGLLFVALGCGSTQQGGGPGVGNMAPEFKLDSLDGKMVSLQEQTGRVVLLSFGASWCPYCREEIPMFKALQIKYQGQPFRVLYVNIGESKEKTANYATKTGMSYPVLIDADSQVAKLYQVLGIPQVLILDQRGVIRFSGTTNQAGYESVIDQLLGDLKKDKAAETK